MNKKNKGFSILLAVVGSLILVGVSVGIITSVNRSLDQTSDIARANQFFFAAESGKEAALFHHSVRGQGVNLSATDNIEHDDIGANASWKIQGRGVKTIIGKMSQNEKITIPLFWDNSSVVRDSVTEINMNSNARSNLRLVFSVLPENFNFGTTGNNVLIVWSVSRINKDDKVQSFIPYAPDPEKPCFKSSFFCKQDIATDSGLNFNNKTIRFSSVEIEGMVIPGDKKITSLNKFMECNDLLSGSGRGDCTNYKISFQPVLPFTSTTGSKVSHIDFSLIGADNTKIPQNTYTITSEVDFGDFKKELVTDHKEEPAIGAFDYLIFK